MISPPTGLAGPAQGPRQAIRPARLAAYSGNHAVSLDKAVEIILAHVSPLGSEYIGTLEAVNRVLSEDIVSGLRVPPYDCSARDGYAVSAADTQGASRDNPRQLRISGELRAGAAPGGQRLEPGLAVRIMTGAPMPAGADAVVQFEDAQERGGLVEIFAPVAARENYRLAGDNIDRGQRVLSRGDRLNPADVGILASLNHATVGVYRQPRVAVLSTGDELAGPGEDSGLDKIRDVNAFALCAETKKYNALPTYLGIARDNLSDLRQLFARALDCDVIISTGGGSMGRYDFVREVYADLGIKLLFGRVNVKPGKPCSFGTRNGKLFFSLPGNPVSALTSFIQFVRPALLKLMGASKVAKPVVGAILQDDIVKRQTRNLRLLRGRFTVRDGQFVVSTMGDQKPSVFQSMRDANCLIMVPENTTRIAAGEQVAIQLIYHDEI